MSLTKRMGVEGVPVQWEENGAVRLEEDEGKCHLYIEIAPTASVATSIPTASMLLSEIWMVLEWR